MCLPSTNLMRRVCLLMLCVAAVCTAALPNRAVAGPEPSPFEGHYVCSSFLEIRIAGSGRVGGSLFGMKISGTIWNDGFMVLDWPTPTWDSQRRQKVYYRTIIGLAALDENGNLYGVLDGSEFFWPRCE
jgi:hypothetical protein